MNCTPNINNVVHLLTNQPQTPVCTTELSAVALSYADFESRGVKLIGLSANNVSSHAGWIADIDSLTPDGPKLDFPIIGDEDRKVSTLYGMLDNLDKTNVDAKVGFWSCVFVAGLHLNSPRQ